MVCPNYLIWYDVGNPDANKQRWEEDKKMLKMLSDNGIRHIYLNINRTVEYYPAGVLESYFDLLEEYDIAYGLQIGSPMDQRDTDYYAIRALNGQITTKAAGPGTVEAVGEINMATLGSGSITGSSCKYLAIDNASGQAVDSGDGTAKLTADGKIKYTASINAATGGDYTVYFTPRVGVRESQFVDPYKNAEAVYFIFPSSVIS